MQKKNYTRIREKGKKKQVKTSLFRRLCAYNKKNFLQSKISKEIKMLIKMMMKWRDSFR